MYSEYINKHVFKDGSGRWVNTNTPDRTPFYLCGTCDFIYGFSEDYPVYKYCPMCGDKKTA